MTELSVTLPSPLPEPRLDPDRAPLVLPKKNRRRKSGGQNESRAKARIQTMGYLRIHQARPTVYWIAGRPRVLAYDIHRAFDFNALHVSEPDLHVQVTTHKARSARRRKVTASMKEVSFNHHHLIQLWSYGHQVRLGHHLRVEWFKNGVWMLVGNFRYNGKVIP